LHQGETLKDLKVAPKLHGAVIEAYLGDMPVDYKKARTKLIELEQAGGLDVHVAGVSPSGKLLLAMPAEGANRAIEAILGRALAEPVVLGNGTRVSAIPMSLASEAGSVCAVANQVVHRVSEMLHRAVHLDNGLFRINQRETGSVQMDKSKGR
jgi:hypothetical protein